MATKQLLTAEDLLELGDSDGRFELIKGVLYEMSPDNYAHARIRHRLSVLLEQLERAGAGVICSGEPGLFLERNPDTIVAPDLALVPLEAIPPTNDQERMLDTAPRLAVEIVSPSNTAARLQEKIGAYLDAGVEEVWIVYPRTGQVAVHRSDRHSELLGEYQEIDAGRFVPNLRIPVSQVFPER